MGKAQLEQLEQYGNYLSVPRGQSMRPMLRSKQNVVEIHRLEGRPKRGELVLYVREGEEEAILHRVIRLREKDCLIAGDNCSWQEAVPYERVVGIAVRFYRGGRWHEVTEPGYRLYARLWTASFFLRSPLLRLRDRGSALLARLRKKPEGTR